MLAGQIISCVSRGRGFFLLLKCSHMLLVFGESCRNRYDDFPSPFFWFAFEAYQFTITNVRFDMINGHMWARLFVFQF